MANNENQQTVTNAALNPRATLMTPSLAKALINSSPKIARPVSKLRCAAMADRMRHPDPEDGPVGYVVDLDRDGHLVSGRHVLLAVILADRPVPMMLGDNCEPSPFTHYKPFNIHKAGA